MSLSLSSLPVYTPICGIYIYFFINIIQSKQFHSFHKHIIQMSSIEGTTYQQKKNPFRFLCKTRIKNMNCGDNINLSMTFFL